MTNSNKVLTVKIDKLDKRFIGKSDEEIKFIYDKLNTDLLKYNEKFFHYNEHMLAKFLRNPENSLKFRFNKFIKNWQNFNAHKQLLYHFFNIDHSLFGDFFCGSVKMKVC